MASNNFGARIVATPAMLHGSWELVGVRLTSTSPDTDKHDDSASSIFGTTSASSGSSGEEATLVGSITYDVPNYTMSALIATAVPLDALPRHNIPTNGPTIYRLLAANTDPNASGAPVMRAFRVVTQYAGTYSCSPAKSPPVSASCVFPVHHHVSSSMNPAYVGRQLDREATLVITGEGLELALTGRLGMLIDPTVGELRWRRKRVAVVAPSSVRNNPYEGDVYTPWQCPRCKARVPPAADWCLSCNWRP
jgi:hypothetical protein